MKQIMNRIQTAKYEHDKNKNICKEQSFLDVYSGQPIQCPEHRKNNKQHNLKAS